ncbi:MAG: FAD-binding oxidoreductase, partial [Nocardioidaceae bacterium]
MARPPGAEVATAFLAQLEEALPAGAVVTDPDILHGYARDQATFCPAGRPLCLVRARETDDVAVALRAAHRYGVPVVPQGARTGLSGGANAVAGCLLLSLERMDRIIDVDLAEQTATVQAGVVNATLSRAVEQRGLFYPPDPASWESCTIGGNVATNAGGLCCVKYGVTGDWVRGLVVVLADGRVMRTGHSTVKGVAGYDLTHLFVGSEGTLGVVAEVVVALRPQSPAPHTAAAFFPTASDACRAVGDYMASGARPSMLELMDHATLALVERLQPLGLPEGTGALLLARSDDPGRPKELERFADICTANAATDVIVTDDPAEGELLVNARRLVGPAHEAAGSELVEDVCVPRGRLAELVDGVARIATDHQLTITSAGHAGDGNMHP